MYRLEILDNNLQAIGAVKTFPTPNSDVWLRYSRKLSDHGEAVFNVATRDPLFMQFGDILQPFANHVRIYRDGALVWSGVVAKVSTRNKDYTTVHAYEYLWLLSKTLIQHDASPKDPNYRTFDAGTMADAIKTIISESVAKAGIGSPLKQMVVGQVDNPPFPAGYVMNGQDMSGKPWVFSTDLPLKFDYRDALYVLQQFGIYAGYDFELTPDMHLNFEKVVGTDRQELVFEFDSRNPYPGNVENFDVPLDGDNMANSLIGVSTNIDLEIIKSDASDQASITKYGVVEGVAAYSDVKDANLLKSRLREELLYVATPDSSVSVILNERAYPLGQYSIGDIVTVKLDHYFIHYNKPRRIVGYDVQVHLSGKENIQLETNAPRTYK